MTTGVTQFPNLPWPYTHNHQIPGIRIQGLNSWLLYWCTSRLPALKASWCGDIFVCTMATLCSSLYRLSAIVSSSEARLCYSQVAFKSNSPSFPGYTTIRDLIPAHLSSCVSLNRLGDKFHAIKCSWEPEPSCKIPKIIFSELKNLSTILPPPSQKKPSANQQTG